jgi:uncharacterized membrane protein
MDTVAELEQHIQKQTNSANGSGLLFWSLLALYCVARFLQVYPGRVPMLVVVALHVFPPAIFAVLHGAKTYAARGVVVFVAITLLFGNFFENLGVRTGFPFGHYYFTDLMGPKLGAVPIMLGLAYVGMAYLSWELACIISRRTPSALSGLRAIAVPLLASCIMVSWDSSQDPVWSTVLHAWVWLRGGAYFGVPIANFFGWFLTVYAIYQSFAMYLLRQPPIRAIKAPGHWREVVLFFGASAMGNLLLILPQSRFSTVIDATGMRWKVSTITQSCAVVTVLTMGAFTFWAWRRLSVEQ